MPRASHVLPYATIAVVALLAGCGKNATAPSTPASAAPAQLVSGSPSVVEPSGAGVVPPSVEPSGAPPGTLTCAELGGAIQRASLMQPGVVDGIVRTSGTADAPVADAAQRLVAAYVSAVAAKGSDSEPDAVAAVSAAAADMEGVCEQSGLATTG